MRIKPQKQQGFLAAGDASIRKSVCTSQFLRTSAQGRWTQQDAHSICLCRMYAEKGERNKAGESIRAKKGKSKTAVPELKP